MNINKSHAHLVASTLRDKGFPAKVERSSDLSYFVTIQFLKRMCTSIELTIALDELLDDNLVTVKSIGGIGIVTIN